MLLHGSSVPGTGGGLLAWTRSAQSTGVPGCQHVLESLLLATGAASTKGRDQVTAKIVR